MAADDFPAPSEGFVLTHFIVAADVARSRDFYAGVLGGKVVMDGEPTIVKLANGWVIINVGGGPTEDKPEVVLEPPGDPTRASAFLNLRVADVQACYQEWGARGAEFLTPPMDRGAEIRCYMRDPDGHLIEVGQSTRTRGDEGRTAGSGGATSLPQGDVGLLESDTAKRLLGLSIPARLAYVAVDGTPRVVPTWFLWTGGELVMATFVAAPHVRHAAARLAALRANPAVAVTIDTEGNPPTALSIRGRATVTEVDGVAEEYAQAAPRYMGAEAAARYLAMLDQPGTRMARIAVRPAWVGLVDFQTRMPSTLGGVTG